MLDWHRKIGTEDLQECLELVQNIQKIYHTVKHMGSPENMYVMKQTVAAAFVLSTCF